MPELAAAVEYEARRDPAAGRRDALAARAAGRRQHRDLPTENRSVLSYLRAHPRSAPFLSLTNFSDVAQSADAGIIDRAGLHQPVHAHSSTGRLDISDGRIELPPWGFTWLTGI